MGKFANAKFFTTLDLRGAYNLIRIKAGHEWKAAFRCQYGLYEPLVVQFGLVNAPSVFQRFILSLFLDLLDICVVVYLDDILVYSDNLDDHIKQVSEVLRRIDENNLVLKPEKCVFHASSVTYLGHVISSGGIQMSPDKTTALLDFPAPRDVKELRSFLGLANYYRKFLPRFSEVALPLTNLTKKDRAFAWDEMAQKAFEGIKNAIANDVLLQHPCYENQFEVFTDASDFAIGAVLTQCDENGDARPLEFFSRKLLPSEQNYSVYDKELLAIVEAFRHWRHFLVSSTHEVLVHSDHKNLSYFRKAQLLKPRHARWAEFLNEFSFKISHIDGNANAVADALSRSPTFRDSPPSVPEKSEKIVVLPEEHWPDGTVLATVTVLPESVWLDVGLDATQVEEEPHEWPEDVARYLHSEDSEWLCDEHTLEDFGGHIGDFSLLGDRLYRVSDGTKRLYLPKNQRKDTLRRFHDGLGHLASDSILPLLKRRYWWPDFERSVRDYISDCPRCQLARGQPIGSSYVQPIPPVALPFERWGLDFMQNLPVTMNGNKHIITCIDYATRWVVAEAVSEMTTETVVRFLYKSILMNYGAPFEIITDRGKAFLSEAVQQFESLHHIRHISTTPYHPQTNGMVERMHAMINHALTTLTGSRPNRWDDYLDSTIFAIRVRTHAVTRKSPFYLLFGVDPRLPGDLEPPRQAMAPLSSLEQQEFNDEFTARELDQLGQDRAAAYHRSLAQARRMESSRSADDNTTHYFEIGDWVKIKNFDRGKFEFRWKGPYTIVELGHPRTYWLMAPDGRRLDSTVNESHLAPWTASLADNQDFFYDGTQRDSNSGF
jgi:transposase InsO family protein